MANRTDESAAVTRRPQVTSDVKGLPLHSLRQRITCSPAADAVNGRRALGKAGCMWHSGIRVLPKHAGGHNLRTPRIAAQLPGIGLKHAPEQAGGHGWRKGGVRCRRWQSGGEWLGGRQSEAVSEAVGGCQELFRVERAVQCRKKMRIAWLTSTRQCQCVARNEAIAGVCNLPCTY
jgi:hypothetical protein